ncbi:UNVERIFIED_ORG: hypothetical protein QE446_004779 [Rhizobium sp. SORGH_AS260]|nr:hypothetical protein [Rhizobium sp. SORGH_AS_0285]MDP9756855.1 hypothetical protein [Rhizobium sp. SORGH_AS_0260]MDR6083896.1 hypothetical protein [Agrobacterium sp. SORGH_AS_0440]
MAAPNQNRIAKCQPEKRAYANVSPMAFKGLSR